MTDPDDFAPPLLRLQERPPAPLAGWMLRLLLFLLTCVALWAALGQLDIYCDSGPNHKEQWDLVREQAKLFYGADGQARTRPAPVQV